MRSPKSHLSARYRYALALAIAASAACDTGVSGVDYGVHGWGRLTARVQPAFDTVPAGLAFQTLPADSRRIGVFVPRAYDRQTTWPVVLLLHGSYGSGADMASDFQTYAERAGVVIIAPSSRADTWDRISVGYYGPDVEYLDRVLRWTFDHVSADPTRLTIAGFSDGATYSLLLGLKNGDLFPRIVAFAPCARIPTEPVGSPRIMIAHGTDDQVLPIDECSRALVPELRLRGYSVEFLEYPSAGGDGHFVTPEIAERAFAWIAAR